MQASAAGNGAGRGDAGSFGFQLHCLARRVRRRRSGRDAFTRGASRFGLSKLHIEPRGSLEVVDWIVLDHWYAELKRYCEILGRAPPHAE